MSEHQTLAQKLDETNKKIIKMLKLVWNQLFDFNKRFPVSFDDCRERPQSILIPGLYIFLRWFIN